MNNFQIWCLKEAFSHKDSEIYFMEDLIAIKSETGTSDIEVKLPGKKIYTVINNDEEKGIVTLKDEDGGEYTFNQDALSKALSEDAGSHGFQALQYPVGYLLATSSDKLANLSVYDSRLKKFTGEKSKGPGVKMTS